MSNAPVIIIAEPDRLFGNMLRVEFSQIGFTPLMAGNGPEAENFAALTPACLVLLDAALPGVSSFDACARIRHRPEYRQTPIVLTARNPRRRLDAAAATAGATGVLLKPYAFGDLIHALEAHLPPDHPLQTARPRMPAMAETKAKIWGPLPPLTWNGAPDSGLARNAAMLPIVRALGTLIPLKRKP